MKRDAIILRDIDNVATLLRDAAKGEEIRAGLGDGIVVVIARDDLPFGHKFAVRDISRGEDILKYGEVIGRATSAIAAGSHAHVQNVESLRGRGDLA